MSKVERIRQPGPGTANFPAAPPFRTAGNTIAALSSYSTPPKFKALHADPDFTRAASLIKNRTHGYNRATVRFKITNRCVEWACTRCRAVWVWYTRRPAAFIVFPCPSIAQAFRDCKRFFQKSPPVFRRAFPLRRENFPVRRKLLLTNGAFFAMLSAIIMKNARTGKKPCPEVSESRRSL